MPEVYDQTKAQRARELVTAPARVDHSGKGNGRDARQFFLEFLDEETVNKVFSQIGEIIVYTGQLANLEHLHWAFIWSTLRDRIKHILDIVNLGLVHGHNGTFNEHGKTHIDTVTFQAVILAEQAGASRAELVRLVIAAVLHDLGNLLSRSLHPQISQLLVPAFVPELNSELMVEYPSEYDPLVSMTERINLLDVEADIYFHDEKNASAAFGQIEAELRETGRFTPERFYQLVRERLGVAALSLLAADKRHAIHKDRFLDDGREPDMGRDPHSELVALGSSLEYEFLPEEKTIIRRVMFSPLPPANIIDMTSWPTFTKSNGEERTRVSDRLHHYHLLHGIPHFFTWQRLMWQLNANRIDVEAKALFALYPDMEKFQIIVEDAEDLGDPEAGLRTVYSFTREGIFEELTHLRENYSLRDDEHIDDYTFHFLDQCRFWQDGRLKSYNKQRKGHEEVQIFRDLNAPNPNLVETRWIITDENRQEMLPFLERLFTPFSQRKGNRNRGLPQVG